jgi:predicted enzyme related to lactoylglutathione lyase
MKTLRVEDPARAVLAKSADFYRQALGVQVVRHVELAQGLCAMSDLAGPGGGATLVEVIRGRGRNGCKLAYVVPDVPLACRRLQASGAVICRAPRDGGTAMVCSPGGIAAELIPDSTRVLALPA